MGTISTKTPLFLRSENSEVQSLQNTPAAKLRVWDSRPCRYMLKGELFQMTKGIFPNGNLLKSKISKTAFPPNYQKQYSAPNIFAQLITWANPAAHRSQ